MQHGAIVEIAEIDPERAEKARSEIAAAGGKVRGELTIAEHMTMTRPQLRWTAGLVGLVLAWSAAPALAGMSRERARRA